MTLSTLALAVAIAATLVGVGVFGAGVTAIVRTVGRGGAAPGRTAHPARRTWLAMKLLVGHGRFAHRPLVRAAHWFVMVSFPVLVLTLAGAYGQLVDPHYVLPVLGRFAPLELLTEAIAWASLLGIVALIVVRQVSHPRRAADGGRASRFYGSNAGQAYVVETVVLVVVLAVIALRGLEHALELAPGAASAALTPDGAAAVDPGFYPLTAWLGRALSGVPLEQLETAVVLVALLKILASMTWMVIVGRRPAMGVSWHRFLAVVNVWARREVDGRPALGALPPVRAAGQVVDFDALDTLPDDARLGVDRIEDFTWKGLLDFSTCTECGRCQEQCPAWNTGKPLSPKLVVMALRDHAYATTPWLQAGANGPTAPAGLTTHTGHVPVPGLGAPPAGAPSHADLDVLGLVGGVVDPQALWDCTTCGACVQQCPVDIEHVDHIVDLRRNQVMMAAAFPTELGQTFTKLERRGNPWGLPAKQRLDWAKDLAFEVPVIGVDVQDATAVEYLFWVGCAGAYEDRAKRTTRAVAELLHVAGVSFAVLGDGESCTGDPARRAGNELLFQTLAQANVETLQSVGATRVVVTCAHCFNTIAREYPQLGGTYEVVHHTELLDTLVRDGRLTPVARPEPTGTVTYHDPCYLGRHNQVYSPPRDLIGALPGVTLVEMPRSRETAFCCGGGGARVWMEESTGTRIGTVRAAEAVATGAGAIATACPFCTVMLTDGVAAATAGAAPTAGALPEVVDVAVLLRDAVRPTGA